ncbi:MAG TPA: hypothetical protein VMU50_05400 [Polyangia bacterium]|nr:hypothetical protein [Polyangia bacterium]
MSSVSPQPEAKARDEVKPRLCVVLACHHVVCALPIDNIDRLVLPDAVEALPSPRPAAGGPREDPAAAVPDVVRVGERFFAAWDLGVLFGLGPVAGAWVLLSLMHEGVEVWLALRTGPCFAVQSLRNLMKLPSEVFQSRRGALTDGFATAAVKKEIEADVGVLVDPRGLWSRQELQMSAAVLAAVEGRGRGTR